MIMETNILIKLKQLLNRLQMLNKKCDMCQGIKIDTVKTHDPYHRGIYGNCAATNLCNECFQDSALLFLKEKDRFNVDALIVDSHEAITEDLTLGVFVSEPIFEEDTIPNGTIFADIPEETLRVLEKVDATIEMIREQQFNNVHQLFPSNGKVYLPPFPIFPME